MQSAGSSEKLRENAGRKNDTKPKWKNSTGSWKKPKPAELSRMRKMPGKNLWPKSSRKSGKQNPNQKLPLPSKRQLQLCSLHPSPGAAPADPTANPPPNPHPGPHPHPGKPPAEPTADRHQRLRHHPAALIYSRSGNPEMTSCSQTRAEKSLILTS